MTLTEAMEQQAKDPSLRIIRKGNDRGMICVWFTVKNNELQCNTWEMDSNGHYINTRRAAFQTSDHIDWILIPR